MRRIAAIAFAVLAAAQGAPAHTPGQTAHKRCVDLPIDDALCDVILHGEEALQRPGLSAEDFTDHAGGTVEIADFYFAARLAIARNGQEITFVNTNAPGGNPHSVSSGDWGGDDPVLPVPVLGFGAGDAFRSSRLGPGERFTVLLDVATLDPDAYVLLPSGDALVGYHCYIHGAAQMSGALLVRGVTR